MEPVGQEFDESDLARRRGDPVGHVLRSAQNPELTGPMSIWISKIQGPSNGAFKVRVKAFMRQASTSAERISSSKLRLCKETIGANSFGSGLTIQTHYLTGCFASSKTRLVTLTTNTNTSLPSMPGGPGVIETLKHRYRRIGRAPINTSRMFVLNQTERAFCSTRFLIRMRSCRLSRPQILAYIGLWQPTKSNNS